MTAIPGSLLADVYEKYGTRLLELNVRAFLGLRGRKSVNAALRRTPSSKSRLTFWHTTMASSRRPTKLI